MFYVTILNVFNILTSKQIFWKTKTLVKKPEYLFLVESTKIENASFSYKAAISETNVKTNRMVTAKWTYHKERSFARNYFIFLKILFWCTSNPNAHIYTFCNRLSLIWRWFFPDSILKGFFITDQRIQFAWCGK